MSLLSFNLFDHCSSDSEDAIGSDFLEKESAVCGVNEVTGLPLLSSGVKGCSGAIDVAGNPRASDFTSLSDLNPMIDTIPIVGDMTNGIDTSIENGWMDESSSIDSGFDDFGCSDISLFDSDW